MTDKHKQTTEPQEYASNEAKDDSEEKKKGSEPKEQPRNSWFLWTRDIVICLILVLLFRANVAEANYIPSPSMEPTLMVSDRIIVDKLSMHWRSLQRGDMVVFHPPQSGHENERWIKRVIGLPGETIQVIDGKVFINGERLEEPYVKDVPPYSVGPIKLKVDDPSTKADENEYYLLGDNRPNSRDSHVWGPCPEDRIIGRAVFRYWPLNSIGVLKTSDEMKLEPDQ